MELPVVKAVPTWGLRSLVYRVDEYVIACAVTNVTGKPAGSIVDVRYGLIIVITEGGRLISMELLGQPDDVKVQELVPPQTAAMSGEVIFVSKSGEYAFTPVIASDVSGAMFCITLGEEQPTEFVAFGDSLVFGSNDNGELLEVWMLNVMGKEPEASTLSMLLRLEHGYL